MNVSNYQSVTDYETALIFKGALFELAPLNIPLCLTVFTQNSVIFISYYKDKAKLVPSLFMGIALGDILKAQGDLILTIISILVHWELVETTVLYKSIYYYMVTAIPGFNCAKLSNLILTVTLTLKLRDPFHVINTSRLRKIAASICLVVFLLHIVDALVSALRIDSLPLNNYPRLLKNLGPPGILAIWGSTPTHQKWLVDRICASLEVLYFFVPPVLIMVCMILQVKYLRRSLGGNEGSSHIPNTFHHVSVTVLMVSVLFFICQSALGTFQIVWNTLKLYKKFDHPGLEDKEYVEEGILIGFTEFSLPLIYAVFYPIILICRKPDLRERYYHFICRFRHRQYRNINHEQLGEH